MDYYQFTQILNGNFDHIPKEKSKTVRIFLSSTFSDTHAERDYLLDKVYPKLKTYCKTTYGLDFQILDMRWGINSEVTNSHLTTTICLNEIRTCQKYSAGPNFIAFLSHRYGAIGLPTRIIKEEYELFAKEIEAYKEALDLSFHYDEKDDSHLDGAAPMPAVDIENLFGYCYELDDNEIPARYKLKHLDRVFTGFDHKNPIFDKMWNLIETKLGNILKKTAQQLVDKKVITKTQYERYFVSVTEKEIYNGILNCKKPEDNVLYFQRNIVDIEDHLGDANLSTLRKYMHLDKDDHIDEHIKSLLDDLKNVKIPSKLPNSNIFKFDVKWDEKHGVTLATHVKYLEEFANTFYEQVKRLIDKGQQQKTDYSYLSEDDLKLLQEVLDHANFLKESVEKFHGRNDLLDKIRDYLINDVNMPLILHGESGCGKTAILAKITSKILKIVPDPQNYTIVLRFMGTTPLSSNILNVFNSIVYQLSKLFNIKTPEKAISSKTALRDYLYTLLSIITEKWPNKKLVIVLDSIDQLNTSDYNLDWFIYKLPHNVKMIYSTLPNHGEILNHLSKSDILSENPNSFITITGLTTDLAKLIIQDWLKKAKRSISAKQSEALYSMINKSTLYPLYIKILFDIISKWTSFYEPDEEFLKALNIDQCIKYLFKSLEQTHGKLLFSRSIIYLTSFKNGISENELEDILSLDDEVLYDIFEFHAPPSRRLPSALWSRIKHDLKEYMVEKEIDDTRVIYWYHRRFIEVSNSFYISKLNSNERQSVFSNVVDFYNETWKHTPKPYRYNDFLKRKFKLETEKAEEVRNTSMQPTVFVDPNGVMRFNKRKISELPMFIAQLTNNLSAPLSCENIYFSFHFITGLFASCSFSDIYSNFEQINQQSSYTMNEEAKAAHTELKMMALVFLQCGINMKDYPFSAITLILFRTLKFYGYKKYLTKMIDEYDREMMKLSSLVLTNQFLPPPGNELIFQFDKHTLPITHGAIGADNDSLIFSLSNKLMLFNMSTVQELGSIELKKSDPKSSYEFLLIYIDEEPTELQMKDLSGGFVVATRNEICSYGFDSVLHFAKNFGSSRSILDIHLLSEFDVAVAFENENIVEIYDLKSSEIRETLKFDMKVKRLFCNTHKEAINEFYFDQTNIVCLIVLFEDNSMDFYSVKYDKDEPKQLEVKKLRSRPSAGVELISLKFHRKNYKDFSFDFFVCTYDNGTICYKPSDQDYLLFVQPELKDIDSPHLVFTHAWESHLFIEKKTGCLLIINWKKLKSQNNVDAEFGKINSAFIGRIPGNFDDARFIRENKIAAISLGMVTFFMLSNLKPKIEKNAAAAASEANQEYESIFDTDEVYIDLFRVAQIDAHFEPITFLFNKEDMLLTCSKDTTMKVFLLHSNMERRENAEINLDRSANDITSLSPLDEQHVVAKLKNSLHLDIWNIAEGKIVSNVKLEKDNGVIKDIIVTNNNLVISIVNEAATPNKKLNIRICSYNNQDLSKSKAFIDRFNVDIDFQDNYKLLNSTSTNLNLFVLTESMKTNEIKLYHITESNDEKNQPIKMSKPVLIALESIFVGNNRSAIENSCITSSSNENYVVIFTCQTLFYIDSKSGKIITSRGFVEEEINLSYFLSPTNLSTNQLSRLTNVPNSTNLVALNNLNELVYVEYIPSVTKINLIYSRLENKFDSFEINSESGFLIALDNTASELLVFDLSAVLRKSSFAGKNCLLFKINVNQSTACEPNGINKFGCNPSFEFVYVIENKKILKVYQIDKDKKQAKLSGEIPLYSEALDIKASHDFISIAMQDRKVISFLYVDSNKPDESYEKVKKLPRRNVKRNEEFRKKVDAIFNSNAQMLDSSSDDDDDLEDLVKNNDNKIAKKIEIIKIDMKIVSCEKKNYDELKPNYLLSETSPSQNRAHFKQDIETILNGDQLEKIDHLKAKDLNNNGVEEFQIELKDRLKNREPEIKTRNTGKNVVVSNMNKVSKSRACLIQ